jgi:hypothetical protein
MVRSLDHCEFKGFLRAPAAGLIALEISEYPRPRGNFSWRLNTDSRCFSKHWIATYEVVYLPRARVPWQWRSIFMFLFLERGNLISTSTHWPQNRKSGASPSRLLRATTNFTAPSTQRPLQIFFEVPCLRGQYLPF